MPGWLRLQPTPRRSSTSRSPDGAIDLRTAKNTTAIEASIWSARRSLSAWLIGPQQKGCRRHQLRTRTSATTNPSRRAGAAGTTPAAQILEQHIRRNPCKGDKKKSTHPRRMRQAAAGTKRLILARSPRDPRRVEVSCRMVSRAMVANVSCKLVGTGRRFFPSPLAGKGIVSASRHPCETCCLDGDPG